MDDDFVPLPWKAWQESCFELGGGLEMSCPDQSEFAARARVKSFDGRIVANSICTQNTGSVSKKTSSRAGKEFITIQVIERGQAILHSGEDEVFAKPGDLVIRDWTREHSITSLTTGEEVKQALVISLPRRIIETQLERVDKLDGFFLDGTLPATRLTVDYFRSLERNIGALDNEESIAFSNVALDLLGNALSLRLCQQPERTAQALQRVTNEMTERIWDADLKIDDIAASVGMTPRTIQRLFQSVGTTPLKWVENRRIERIANELKASGNSSRSITEIAFAMGFNDLSTFSRAFKRNTGMSPRQFRKQHRS